MVDHDKYRKYCTICKSRVYKHEVHNVMVKTPDITFQGGLLCGDCWNFLANLAQEHKDEFLHNKIRIRNLRQKES